MRKKTLWAILMVLFAASAVFGPFVGDKPNGIGETIVGIVGCVLLSALFWWQWKKADPDARFGKGVRAGGVTNGIPSDYVAIDIETTGLSPQRDNIIELGAVRVRHGKPTEQFSQLIYPGMPLPAKITGITGITDADLAGKPDLRAVLPAFLSFVGNDVVVGHNLRFDLGFINAAASSIGMAGVSNPTVDTLPLAQATWPELPNHKLETLIRHLGIADKEAHRGADDALRTAQVLEAIRKA